jgi:hypothetical protein
VFPALVTVDARNELLQRPCHCGHRLQIYPPDTRRTGARHLTWPAVRGPRPPRGQQADAQANRLRISPHLHSVMLGREVVESFEGDRDADYFDRSSPS